MRPLSAQEEHDHEMEARTPRLISHAEMKALLAEAQGRSSGDTSFEDFDPIANAMARHPGLTREKAEAMAEAFGF